MKQKEKKKGRQEERKKCIRLHHGKSVVIVVVIVYSFFFLRWVDVSRCEKSSVGWLTSCSTFKKRKKFFSLITCSFPYMHLMLVFAMHASMKRQWDTDILPKVCSTREREKHSECSWPRKSALSIYLMVQIEKNGGKKRSPLGTS
jgi:hypothetical protein